MPELSHGEREADLSVLGPLRWTLVLSGAILLIEGLGALLSRSLALTTDAVHNIPDILGFAVSWLAVASVARGATSQHTFGLHRSEVFASVVNATLLLGTGLGFGYTAVLGLMHGGSGIGGPLNPVWLLFAAVPTLGLRVWATALVGRIPRRARDLNLRSVYLHLLSDIAISIPILAAGFVLILRPSLQWVDAAAALPIAAVLVGESFPLYRDSWDALSERIPRHLSLDQITQIALHVPNVEGLHDVHVWSVCSNLICMTAHVRVKDITVGESMGVVAELRKRMAEDVGIGHAVFEIESEGFQGHRAKVSVREAIREA